MSYLYRKGSAPRTAPFALRPLIPPPPPQTVAARSRRPVPIARGPVRVRYVGTGTNLGDALGIVPLVAAAVPSVQTLLKNAAGSIVGIFDPGKKRDAERKARADMYLNLALQGSITAANRLYSASISSGIASDKEKGWYQQNWRQFSAQMPDLAAKVLALPRVGLPDPQRPELSPADTELIQNEINAFHGIVPKTPANTGGASSVLPAGFSGIPAAVLVLGLAGAYFFARKR